MSVAIPTENLSDFTSCAAGKLNTGVTELRRLFLVDNMVDTIKFGLSLWCLTYIGAWFNAMTLIILAWVAVFSIPKVYQMNQVNKSYSIECHFLYIALYCYLQLVYLMWRF